MPPLFSPSDSAHQTVILPDLVSHCRFKLRLDRNHKLVSSESNRWFLSGDLERSEVTRGVYRLKAGKLSAMCYPHCGYPQLRVCADFLNWFFHLDNLSDDMDDRRVDSIADVVMNSLYHPYTYQSATRLNRMTKDWYKRFLETAAPGARRRFQDTMALFFKAIRQQALDRANGTIPDLESYIALRRNTSGCKPSWAIIEYAYHLRIPDDVMAHPVLQSLGEAANDLVTWSNDIFSYDVEHAQGHTHNMIDVLMHADPHLTLQAAFDAVGDACKQAIDRFVSNHAQLVCLAGLGAWDHVVDADVRKYADGLANWIVGSLHWSFETERYFGPEGGRVKQTRRLVLRGKCVRAAVPEQEPLAR